MSAALRPFRRDGRFHGVRRWWSEHPSLDLWTAALLAGAQFGAALRWLPAMDVLQGVDNDQLSALYLGIAGVIGLVNAFSLTALGFVRGDAGPRLRILRQRTGGTVIRSWLFSVVGSLAVAGVLLLLAILAAAEVLPFLRWVALAGVYFALLAGARSLWIFAQVVLVEAEDLTAPTGQPPPPVVRTGSHR